MAWEQNKDYILSQVNAGTATAGMQDWYNRWLASGSPTAQAGMLTQAQLDARDNTNNGLTFGGLPGGTTYTPPQQTPAPAPAPAPDPEPTPQYNSILQGYFDRGIIDANGNIVNPSGINVANVLNTQPSWMNQLTEEQRANLLSSAEQERMRIRANSQWSDETWRDAYGDVDRSQYGSQTTDQGFTFGGSSDTNQPAYTAPVQTPEPSEPVAPIEWADDYQFTQRSGGTPFLDAYNRVRSQAQAKGPVSSLFARELEGN